MSDWGEPCLKCGHPADYHSTTYCRSGVGAGITKPQCDCDGYDSPERARIAASSSSVLGVGGLGSE